MYQYKDKHRTSLNNKASINNLVAYLARIMKEKILSKNKNVFEMVIYELFSDLWKLFRIATHSQLIIRNIMIQSISWNIMIQSISWLCKIETNNTR